MTRMHFIDAENHWYETLGDILSQNGIKCNWDMNILNESDFAMHKQAVKKIKLILLG